MKMTRLTVLGIIALATCSVQAADVISITGLTQANFKMLSEDLASATSYKALTPSEPLGVSGFDMGAEVTSTTLQYTNAVNAACGGCDLDALIIPKLHLHKGLPGGFDVGAMYATDTNTNITLIGFEARYANIEGGMAAPAVATRISWSQLDGIDDLTLDTLGVDVSISKGFAMLTPYAGVGYNWVNSTPSVVGLSSESFSQSKVFVGMNLNTGLLNFDLEMDDTGGAQTVGFKVGLRF